MSEEPVTGKGRPTPKRSEAERRRRTAAPKTRKEAAAQRREKLRSQRSLQRNALVTGDERNLPPREAGPERRLARDYVDSRFALGQFTYALIFAVLVPAFLRNEVLLQALINLVAILAFAVILVQAVLIGRAANRRVQEKYPNAKVPVVSYSMMRALQPRRLRRPPPKVQRGADV